MAKEVYTQDKRYKIYQAPIAVKPGKEWRVGHRSDEHTIYHVVAIARTKEEALEKLKAHRKGNVRKKRTKKVHHKIRTRRDGPLGFPSKHVNLAINALLGHEWVIQDAWIRFREGVLLRDGDFYRVVDNDGNRFKGAKHPRKAIEFWKEGKQAPDDKPAAGQLWVHRRRLNSGLELKRVRSHGHPRDNGPYIIAQVVLFDNARAKWTPIFNGDKARRIRTTPDNLTKHYRRELDPTRSSQ